MSRNTAPSSFLPFLFHEIIYANVHYSPCAIYAIRTKKKKENGEIELMENEMRWWQYIYTTNLVDEGKKNTYFVSSHTDQINDPRIGDVLN